jgi:hypothetical protein
VKPYPPGPGPTVMVQLVGGPQDGRELEASARLGPEVTLPEVDPPDGTPAAEIAFTRVTYRWDGTLTAAGARRYRRLPP